MAAENDIAVLTQIIRVLERELTSSVEKIDELFAVIFERLHPLSRTWAVGDVTKWDLSALSRSLTAIENLVPRYTQIFYDPRDLPVTHSRKQKKTAIHLDQQFAVILREAAARSGFTKWMTPEEAAERDPFLNEPILFLKQLARTKGFPHTKKGGGISLDALRERYRSKLQDKGVRLTTFTYPGP